MPGTRHHPEATAAKWWLLMVGLGLAALGACGGGGGDTPPPSSSSPPTPSPTPTPDLTNRVVLYVVPRAADTSTYVPGLGITLESNIQYLWRLLPDEATPKVLATNTSPSWAPSNIYPYAVDDRIFVREERRPFEQGGSHTLSEFDLQHKPVRSFGLNAPLYYANGCSAVVGDHYYYRSRRNSSVLYGSQGGHFYRYTISAQTTQKLIDHGDSDNCGMQLDGQLVVNNPGVLLSSGGELFEVRTGNGRILLVRRDLTTGRTANVPVADLVEPEPARYGDYQFAVDERVFYMARRVPASGEVELWSYDFKLAAPTPRRLQSLAMPGFTPYRMDADDGHLMVASHNGQVLLYDTATGIDQRLDLGVSIIEITQVFARK
jgi:hypothetical protein